MIRFLIISIFLYHNVMWSDYGVAGIDEYNELSENDISNINDTLIQKRIFDEKLLQKIEKFTVKRNLRKKTRIEFWNAEDLKGECIKKIKTHSKPMQIISQYLPEEIRVQLVKHFVENNDSSLCLMSDYGLWCFEMTSIKKCRNRISFIA